MKNTIVMNNEPPPQLDETMTKGEFFFYSFGVVFVLGILALAICGVIYLL